MFLGKDIKVTGGGAYKYADQIRAAVGLPIDKVDEMKCIVNGCNFLMKNISDETFVYQRKGDPEYKFQNINPQVCSMIRHFIKVASNPINRVYIKSWQTFVVSLGKV